MAWHNDPDPERAIRALAPDTSKKPPKPPAVDKPRAPMNLLAGLALPGGGSNRDLFGMPDAPTPPWSSPAVKRPDGDDDPGGVRSLRGAETVPLWRWFPEIVEQSPPWDRQVVSLVAAAYFQHKWVQGVMEHLVWPEFGSKWDNELQGRTQKPGHEPTGPTKLFASLGETLSARYGVTWDFLGKVLRGARWLQLHDLAGWTALEMSEAAGGSGEMFLPDFEMTVDSLLPHRDHIAP